MNTVLCDGEIRAVLDEDIASTELYQSLEEFGWHNEFPAIADERGKVLVGHRRMKCAELLGIAPVLKTITFGEGEEADASRVKLAIISNLGQAALGREDRKRIAEYLYGEREWTMQRIAAAFGVAERTISRDLGNSDIGSESTRPKSATNPKGAGRPKKGTKNRTKKDTQYKQAQKERAAELFLDQGLTRIEAAATTGIAQSSVLLAVERERGRREAVPEIALASFSMTMQQKLEAWKRQQIKRLDIEYEQKRRDDIEHYLNETGLPAARERFSKMLRDIEYARRDGIMNRLDYMKIIKCLHTDTRSTISDELLNEAFTLFSRLRPMLLSESDDPTPRPHDLPTTVAELLARRKQRGSSTGLH